MPVYPQNVGSGREIITVVAQILPLFVHGLLVAGQPGLEVCHVLALQGEDAYKRNRERDKEIIINNNTFKDESKIEKEEVKEIDKV